MQELTFSLDPLPPFRLDLTAWALRRVSAPELVFDLQLRLILASHFRLWRTSINFHCGLFGNSASARAKDSQ